MNPYLQRYNNNQQGDDCDGWKNKLVGKVILDDTSNTHLPADSVVRRNELPSLHRVLAPNSVCTMDYRPERLNIRVDDSNKVHAVYYG
ncbi:hypothetical protein DM01DRAFT_1406133 [Hesseltinella vesiculosa]|uniref:Proteinase inhibitor I78 n=1 Tax=Hesseltinella vesiculosa TaxID=101127 RepID=A0A1X2GNA6_9FUNG|nr:hypothetical protein DM01DRAFT_1406133 [Hesseltinella vesiculosa]